MIQIKNHKIDGPASGISFSYDETPNMSGPFVDSLPDTIVIHYTAGGSYSSSVNWLKNKQAKASAHLVVGRKGEVVQMVPFNRIAWHAGKSEWKGRKSLNRYSIGIEIANAGILVKRATGNYTSFGHKIDDDKVVLAKHKNRSGEAAWESYTAEQIDMVEKLCLSIIEKYDIMEIVGHDDIAPTRKTDPGPAFPMDSLRSKVLFGRKEDIDTELESEDIVKGIVTADLLNIRNAPAINSPTVSEPLRQGTRVSILETKGRWHKVKVITEGWVSGSYVKTFE